MPHDHRSSVMSNKLLIAFGITLCFVVFELFSGIWAHSLALISDAGHNFVDALALILAYAADKIAGSQSDSSRTFGYHRATILASLINAISLVLIAVFIFFEAYQRFGNVQSIKSIVMIAVAVVALLMNGLIAFWLKNNDHDLNIRSAFIHMLGDAVSAGAIIVAGIIIFFTNAYWIDPLISVVVGIFILRSSWGVIREATNILMESAPTGLDMAGLERVIVDTDGVIAVHDLHVWTISSGMLACSCHIIVSEHTIKNGQQVIKMIIKKLESQFLVMHTTIQVEIEGCDPNDIYCNINNDEAGSTHAQH